jgi:hypothetical protein
MPALNWPRRPLPIIQAFERGGPGRGEIGALIVWASWTVEALHYLIDLNKPQQKRLPPASGQDPDIVNIAHVRWATSSAITALDLCAAALGRHSCGYTGDLELDLRAFDPANTKNKKIPLRRAKLPPNALAWVDRVLGDARYPEVHGARNPLIHSRLIRHSDMAGPHFTRVVVPETGNVVLMRNLIIHSRDLATVRFIEFLEVVERL